MCLNKTYIKVRVGKHLSDIFPVKNGLKNQMLYRPCFFKYVLEYAIRKVQAK